MIKELINDQSLARFTSFYDAGKVLFFEGDDSQDLYILVSGAVDILKGKKLITRVKEPGTLFGEMSFFMCAGRTATAKAVDDVKVVQLPREEITLFLREFPELSREIARTLAERLDETTRVAQGLKEFCDQVPEAVVVIDSERKILTWNRSTEEIFQRSGNDFRDITMDELFDEPEAVKFYLEKLKSKHRPEKVIFTSTNSESRKKRFMNVSGSVLRDDQGGMQGILALITDVTHQFRLEQRYRRIKKAILPIAAALILFTATAGYLVRHPGPGQRSTTEQLLTLGNLLSKDFLVLRSLINEPLAAGDRQKASLLLKDFLSIHEDHNLPYEGILLLDTDKKVFEACLTDRESDGEEMVGQSYGGLGFKSGEKSSHVLLHLYRPDKANPMGRRYTEIAMELRRNGESLGWIIFQMDMPFLEANHGLTEQDLAELTIAGL